MVSNCIVHAQFEYVERSILRAHKIARRTGSSAENVALSGRMGAGKTTILKHLMATYRAGHTPDGAYTPIFYTNIQAPVTLRQTVIDMLEKSGDLAIERVAEAQLRNRLVRRLRSLGVELVIIDDVHNLAFEREALITVVGHWLKSLIKELNVPFVIVGIEGEVEKILRSNKELSRLFQTRLSLKPFAWPDDDEDDEQMQAVARPFIQFVERAWGMIEMRPAPAVDATLLLSQLHQATGGVVGYVMSLLEHTAENAREGKRDHLLLSDFARAFDDHLRGHLLDLAHPGTVIENPFADDEGPNNA